MNRYRLYTWEQLTDAADGGIFSNGNLFKRGQASSFINDFTHNTDMGPILESMFRGIRICNIALKNIHYLSENNVDEVEINDFKGQAHFNKGFQPF